MRRPVLLCFCLGLALQGAGCDSSTAQRDRVTAGFGPNSVAPGPIMRRLLGEEVTEPPLLPQPGNVWADILPPAADMAGSAPPPPADQAAALTTRLRGPAVSGPAAAEATRLRLAAAVSEPTPPAPVRTRPAPEHAVPAAEGAPPRAVPVAGSAPPRPVQDALSPAPPRLVSAAAEAAGSPAPAIAAAPPAAGNRQMVQLTAAHTARQAVAEWQRLREHAPELTDGHLPAISEAEVNGRHVWRLRADGFSGAAAAGAFCSGIRAAKADCWVVASAGPP